MKRMMRWLAIILAGWATVVSAQVDVVKGVTKRNFAVTGFVGDASVAAQVAGVLQNDLRLSGHFKITPSTEAEFVQSGSVRIEGTKTGVIECTVTLAATKKVILAKSYTGSPQDLRRMVHKLADDIVQTVTGQRGIAQSQIAFVWTRGNVKELAVMDYDGHNPRQLTFDKSLSVRPRWSPNGRKIVYTSYINRFPDVLEADLFTGSRRRIAGFPGLNSGAAFSPDGNEIALTLSKDGNPELYVMNAAGGGLQRLTVSPSYNTEPDWSRPPPGSEMKPMLAVTSRVGGQFQIGLYDAATREVRMQNTGGGDSQDPSWAPNGRHLVFSKTQNWRSRLYLLDVLTGELVELPPVEGGASEPAWGP